MPCGSQRLADQQVQKTRQQWFEPAIQVKPLSGWTRPERVYWKPFKMSLIKAKVRGLVRLMQQRHPETIMVDVFYIGLGDRFDDDRRRVRRASSS
jgi:hypothetical protein